jgi:UDP-GlcNAc3NAcA epimerase
MTVVGARPQFVKAAPVTREFNARGVVERIVHTGQHYDFEMSDVFFDSLGIPAPTRHLGIGSLTHGAQTGRMTEALEASMMEDRPDVVLVYGDTNSTLAAALAAAKLHIPVAHVEAGLRSFNRRMPEEVNRVLTDHISTLLFAPTDSAIANLAAEGITSGVVRCGDVMLDTAMLFRENVEEIAAGVPARFGVSPRAYGVVTVHRPENTDLPQRWDGIIEGLRRVAASGLPLIWPVHPRVRQRLDGRRIEGITLVPPQPYFETQSLLMHASVVLTDSGGLQKEAAFHGVPCVTLRDETEWVELVDLGVNRIVGADPDLIEAAARTVQWPAEGIPAQLYGDGHAARTIVDHVERLAAQKGRAG